MTRTIPGLPPARPVPPKDRAAPVFAERAQRAVDHGCFFAIAAGGIRSVIPVGGIACLLPGPGPDDATARPLRRGRCAPILLAGWLDRYGAAMWTLQDAKNRFSAVVEAALAGQPQAVTRRGRKAVVVVAAEDYERLVAAAAERRGSFAAHLMAFPGAEPPRAEVHPRDVAF